MNEVEQESTGLERAVQQAQEEIITIQETAQTETQGGRGTLKINLKWNTTDDLDLHVFDPSGFEIYYGRKEHDCDGVKGQLDVDANASSPYTRTPQENIFWEEGKKHRGPAEAQAAALSIPAGRTCRKRPRRSPGQAKANMRRTAGRTAGAICPGPFRKGRYRRSQRTQGSRSGSATSGYP